MTRAARPPSTTPARRPGDRPVVPRRVEPGPLVAAGAVVLGILAGERAGATPALGALAVGAVLLVVALPARGWAARRARPWSRLALARRRADAARARRARTHAARGVARRARVRRGAEAPRSTTPTVCRFTTAVLVRISTAARARDPAHAVPVHRTVLVARDRARGGRAADHGDGRPRRALGPARTTRRLRLPPTLAPRGRPPRRRERRGVRAAVVAARPGGRRDPHDDVARHRVPRRRRPRAVRRLRARRHARHPRRPSVDAYRAAGLSHLLAVSGANVAFVLALAGPLLRRCSLGHARRARCNRRPGVRGRDAVRTIGAARVARWRSWRWRRRCSGGRCRRRGCSSHRGDRRCCSPTRSSCTRSGFALSVGASAGIACLGPPIARRLPRPGMGSGAARGDPCRADRRRAGAAPGVRRHPGDRAASRTCSRCRSAEPLSVYGIVGVAGAGLAGRATAAGRRRRCTPDDRDAALGHRASRGRAARVPLAIDGRGRARPRRAGRLAPRSARGAEPALPCAAMPRSSRTRPWLASGSDR